MIYVFGDLFAAILLFLVVIAYVLVEYWYVVILLIFLGIVFVVKATNKVARILGIIFLLIPAVLVSITLYDVFNGSLTFGDILEKLVNFL